MAKGKYYTHVEPYLDLIPTWRKKGMTEEQVAYKLEISWTSLKTYKEQYPDFLAVIKKGKAELVGELEGSLYKSSKGYWVEEETTEVEESNLGTKEKKKIHKKWIPANTAHLIFALKNLEPESWKDKQDIEHSGAVPVSIVDDIK